MESIQQNCYLEKTGEQGIASISTFLLYGCVLVHFVPWEY